MIGFMIEAGLATVLGWHCWILWRESEEVHRRSILCAVAFMMVVRQLDRWGF